MSFWSQVLWATPFPVAFLALVSHVLLGSSFPQMVLVQTAAPITGMQGLMACKQGTSELVLQQYSCPHALACTVPDIRVAVVVECASPIKTFTWPLYQTAVDIGKQGFVRQSHGTLVCNTLLEQCVIARVTQPSAFVRAVRVTSRDSLRVNTHI